MLTYNRCKKALTKKKKMEDNIFFAFCACLFFCNIGGGGVWSSGR